MTSTVKPVSVLVGAMVEGTGKGSRMQSEVKDDVHRVIYQLHKINKGWVVDSMATRPWQHTHGNEPRVYVSLCRRGSDTRFVKCVLIFSYYVFFFGLYTALSAGTFHGHHPWSPPPPPR